MPSHKVLKSVVRSVGDSFTSLMNYSDDDYLLGHILNAARRTEKATLEIDLLSGEARPPELLIPPVRQSVTFYCTDFPNIVERSGADMSFVAAARLKLEFDISVSQPIHRGSPLALSPYVCTTTIEDDRGKIYESVLRGSWYPEKVPSQESTPSRLLRLFRRK